MTTLSWLFALGVTVHNIEEALLLPAWSKAAGPWHSAVEPGVFVFAVTILTAAAYVAVVLALRGGRQSFGAYFLAGYALTMALNAFVPHLLATIALQTYAPGTATGLLLNLPLGSLLVYRSLQQGFVHARTFAVTGPLTVVAIAASVPLLFAIAP